MRSSERDDVAKCRTFTKESDHPAWTLNCDTGVPPVQVGWELADGVILNFELARTGETPVSQLSVQTRRVRPQLYFPSPDVGGFSGQSGASRRDSICSRV